MWNTKLGSIWPIQAVHKVLHALNIGLGRLLSRRSPRPGFGARRSPTDPALAIGEGDLDEIAGTFFKSSLGVVASLSSLFGDGNMDAALWGSWVFWRGMIEWNADTEFDEPRVGDLGDLEGDTEPAEETAGPPGWAPGGVDKPGLGG